MLPLTQTVPKPLLPKFDDCLLKQQVAFMRACVKNLHVTVGYMAGMVSQVALQLGVDGVVDIGEGGNASWITTSALGRIETPTLVITCDNLMEVSTQSLLEEAHAELGKSLIVGIEREDDFRGDRIHTIGSKISSMGPSVTSSVLASGLQVIVPQRILNRNQSVDDFSEVWRDLINHGELELAQTRPNSWVAIDTPSDLETWIRTRKNPLD